MNDYIVSDLLERVDDLLEALHEHEGRFYLAIETAHQLRDEISQTDEIYEEE